MKEKRGKGWNFSFYKSPLSLLSYPTTPQDLSFTWLFINYVKPTTWSLHKLARLALAILQASVIVCTHEHFAKSLNKLWTLWVKTTSRTGLTVYAHKNCLHTINPEKKRLDNELSVDTIKFYDNLTASSFKMDLTKLSTAKKIVTLLD